MYIPVKKKEVMGLQTAENKAQLRETVQKAKFILDCKADDDENNTNIYP